MAITNSLPNQEKIESIILRRVNENPKREVCGFLLTDGSSVVEVYFGIGGKNSAAMPLHIPIDDITKDYCMIELIKRGVNVKKMNACKRGMPFFICYHSHPNGNVMPSDEDVEKYIYSNYLLGMSLLNFGNGIRNIRCYEVICSPNGNFNWWRENKIAI